MGDREAFAIRRAAVADAPLLSGLAARLFEQTFGSTNDADNMRAYLSTAFSVEAQTAELADSERATFIATDDAGDAIGYAMIRRNHRANGVIADRPIELQRIYVDKQWHGRHVGDALMATCMEQARAWNSDVL